MQIDRKEMFGRKPKKNRDTMYNRQREFEEQTNKEIVYGNSKKS